MRSVTKLNIGLGLAILVALTAAVTLGETLFDRAQFSLSLIHI